MRDAFNFILPVTRDDSMQTFCSDSKHFPRQTVHISSNGYYGYQPVTVTETDRNTSRTCEMQVCDMDVQFNNLIADECRSNAASGHISRKRNWDYAYEATVPEFKKRRENEKHVSTVKDTESFDIMTMDSSSTSNKNMELLEELLIETHGVSWYHWCGNE